MALETSTMQSAAQPAQTTQTPPQPQSGQQFASPDPAESQSSSQSAPPLQNEFMLPNQPEPEYLLVEWLADSRIAQKRSREYYSSLAVIVLLLSLILFFANQVLLIFVLVSFLFVTYVLASVKPETVHNVITTYGVRYQDRLFYWEQLGAFWLSEHHGEVQVHIHAPAPMLSNQIILLPANSASPVPVTIEDLIDILGRYLPYEEPSPTQIDRWVTWIEEKFPLESKRSPQPANTEPTSASQPTPAPQPAQPPTAPASDAATPPQPQPASQSPAQPTTPTTPQVPPRQR